MPGRLTSPTLIGRADEMATLRGLLADARAGATFATVSGEAGIGKSRLLEALMESARTDGLAVHVGSCPAHVEGPSIPFAAVTQALRSIVRATDARSLETMLGPARNELARLLPELGEAGSAGTASESRGMARLYEATLMLLERTAGRSGLLLVLEDLHWADTSTRSLVSHLCRNLGAAPVLLIVTYRTDGVIDRPLVELVEELTRLPRNYHLRLGPLATADARALLASLPGLGIGDDDRDLVLRRSGGVPLYLEELALPRPVGSPPGPPVSIRTAVQGRLARMTLDARLLVSLVAACDGPVDGRLVTTAARLGDAAARAALRDAMDGHLLVATIDDGQQLDLRHGLLREAVVAGFVPGEGASLRRMLADVLLERPQLGGRSELERANRLARHLLAVGDDNATVPVLLRAADSSRRALAFDAADRLYRAALDMVGDAPAPMPEGIWAAIVSDAAAVARLAGAPSRAVTLQERAIELMGAHTTVADQSIAQVRLGRYLAEAGRWDDALPILRSAVDTSPDDVRRMRALIELVRVLIMSHDHLGAIVHARHAQELARLLGAPRDQARATASLAVALSLSGQHAEALAALADAQQVESPVEHTGATTPSRYPDSLLGYVDRATVLGRSGDPEGASRVALEGSDTARRLGLARSWGHALAATAAYELLRLGRWDEAEAALDAAGTDGTSGPAAQVVRALLEVRRGALPAAEARLRRISPQELAAGPGSGWQTLFAFARAELAMSRSRSEAARAAVRDGLLADHAHGDTLRRAELGALGLRIEADAVTQARDRHDGAAVAISAAAGLGLFAMARSELAVGPVTSPIPWGPAIWSRLDAELTRLQDHDDPGAWRGAVLAADRTPDTHARAYTRLRLAEAILDRSRERTDARAVLLECLASARSIGAEPIVDAAQRLALRARLDLGQTAQADGTATPDEGSAAAPRAAAMALGLSTREIDVLELLARGMTDQEIAGHLFISEKTAGHHVSHILTKLNVTRRGEAAAIGHRLGLLDSQAGSSTD